MKSHSFFKYVFLFLTSFYFFSCDAPRNNPLDPDSPDYKFLDLTGRVLTYRVPHVPIPDVKVTWDNSQYFYTDIDGYFRFNKIVREPGWLYFESKSYLYDSIYVDWNNTRSGLQKYLNASPELDTVLFYSSIENRDAGRQLISLDAELKIFDPDNDIDSVLIVSPTLKFNSFLNYNISDKSFEGSYGMSELKIGTPDAVIGHEFYFYVVDTRKNKILISKQITKRIIKEVIELTQPINSDTASTTPTLKWNRIDPGFPFKFMVEIFVNEYNGALVWRKENISSTTNSVTVDIPLGQNNYYTWIVWVVDEFQNRSGSKPRTFYAKSP